MEEITYINKLGISKILIGESFSNFNKFTSNHRIVVVTDNNLKEIYDSFLGNYQTIVIPFGESSKNTQTIDYLYNEFLRMGVDRSTFIVGFGGGIVCDIVGYAASTFMRGLPFGFISSTLLSQVDASIGGKNGVNFNGFKNMIGTFNQPKFVICDQKLLNTLTDDEFRNGFSEIIKHSLISDSEMFQFIENHIPKILGRDTEILQKIITHSIKAKMKFVEQDEKENGIRRTLNFGHTLAHAIEKTSTLSHGQAVSIGLIFATKWSVEKFGFPRNELLRIQSVLSKLGLPTATDVNKEELLKAIWGDKKRENKQLHFVFLTNIGSPCISMVDFYELEKAILCYV